MSFADFNILGNLGNDVEIKTSNSGHKYAVISVATNQRRKVNDEWQDQTHWHRLVCHREHLMNYFAHFKKGMVASFKGIIKQNVWEDDNQQKHYDVVLEVEDAQLVGRIERTQQNQDYNQNNGNGQGYQNNNQGYQNNSNGQGYANGQQNNGQQHQPAPPPSNQGYGKQQNQNRQPPQGQQAAQHPNQGQPNGQGWNDNRQGQNAYNQAGNGYGGHRG